jgi:hypothetical protein
LCKFTPITTTTITHRQNISTSGIQQNAVETVVSGENSPINIESQNVKKIPIVTACQQSQSALLPTPPMGQDTLSKTVMPPINNPDPDFQQINQNL